MIVFRLLNRKGRLNICSCVVYCSNFDSDGVSSCILLLCSVCSSLVLLNSVELGYIFICILLVRCFSVRCLNIRVFLFLGVFLGIVTGKQIGRAHV